MNENERRGSSHHRNHKAMSSRYKHGDSIRNREKYFRDHGDAAQCFNKLPETPSTLSHKPRHAQIPSNSTSFSVSKHTLFLSEENNSNLYYNKSKIETNTSTQIPVSQFQENEKTHGYNHGNSSSWSQNTNSDNNTPMNYYKGANFGQWKGNNGNESSKINTVAFRCENKGLPQRLFWLPNFEIKFGGFIESLDPWFRFHSNIGTCHLLDSEGIKKFYSKFSDLEFRNAWPFDDDNLQIDQDELKEIHTRITDIVKLCLYVECLKRGYLYVTMRYTKIHISDIWINKLDLISEMNMMKTIVNTLRATLANRKNINFDEIFAIKELDTIFGKILVALQASDTEILRKHNIQAVLASIPDRIKYGFTVENIEIDGILEELVADGKNYGDFPAVANQHVSYFKTRKQLDMILCCVENMFNVIDIRVRNGAVRAITQILQVLPPEEIDSMFSDPFIRRNVNITKMLNCDPSEFDFDISREGRAKYFKIFLTALGMENANSLIGKKAMVAALECFYLICEPFDINCIVYTILSHRKMNCQNATTVLFDKDCDLLCEAMLDLPANLRKQIEVGREFWIEIGKPDAGNKNTMYFQLNRVIYAIPDEKFFADRLYQFMFANPIQILSIERIFRKLMKFVEEGERQKHAVEALLLLKRELVQEYDWSREFIEDILFLALLKYSLPDKDGYKEKKYMFIEDMLITGCHLAFKKGINIDKSAFAERWKALNHPWFTYLYLSEYFEILQGCCPPVEFPWKGNDGENAKNYVELTKLSTTWPHCCFLKLVENVVFKLVPVDINRIELFNGMREFIESLDIDDTWKDDLKKEYDYLIAELKTSSEIGFRDEAVCEKNEGNDGSITENESGSVVVNDVQTAVENEIDELDDLKNLVLDEETMQFCMHVNNEIWDTYDEEKKILIKKIRKAFLKKYSNV